MDISQQPIEQDLCNRVQDLLLDLRRGFALLGQSYPIVLADRHDFSLDLLFYQVQLQCYIVVDVRLDSFQPEFASMLNMYLTTVDEQMRPPSDPASVGILIHRASNSTFGVKYILRKYDSPVGILGYQVVEELPLELQEIFPTLNDWNVVLDLGDINTLA